MASRTDPAQVSTAQLRVQILELRALGLTLEQIGAKVGRAKSNVKKQLDKALDDLAAEQKAAGERYRALAYARLERMLAKAMLLAAGGNLKAMNQAMKLIQTQARLMGFDAPVKVANTDAEGNAVAPGTYVLPSRPDATIEEWQAAAARVLEAQQAREQAAE